MGCSIGQQNAYDNLTFALSILRPVVPIQGKFSYICTIKKITNG